MIEHRWSQRVGADLDVLIIDANHSVSTGKLRNISLYGVYIETNKPYPDNVYLHLRFVLPRHPRSKNSADNSRQIGAMVVHCNHTGMGLMVDTTVAGVSETMHELKQCFRHGLFPAVAQQHHANLV